MSPVLAWFLACRPKTLTVSLSPVLLGSALAWHEAGRFLPWPFLAALAAACLIQIGTNLFNDAGDFLRGTDQAGRLGPRRASAEGWLAPQAVRRGGALAFALAFLCGIYLVVHGGWPIVAIGLASLAAGWAYTGGRWPIAYGPLGELFVILFFGVAALAGSYYLHTLSWSLAALVLGVLLGVQAAAVITVNNYRDLEGDAQSGKRTLAVRLGRRATRWFYAGEMLLPYAVLLGLGAPGRLPMLLLPFSAWLVWQFFHTPPSAAFNRILAMTAALQLAFALLFALGLTIF
ncbi:1,4-dihydroxy-2-naphthoate octaprenyltransferase [Azonexus sp.]|uniref:1,4-dihydroxy-2-naphthoate octaprenyltransferase n=1 Tax=Azonexus sp. TaxID=1872668 RepID=UPI0039E31344